MQVKKYFVAGLLVCVPLFVTLWVLRTVVQFMDLSLQLLPTSWQPIHLFGFNTPGLGLILTAVFIYLIGLIATNFFGRKIVEIWESILHRIPIVRSIYSGGKKITTAILSPGGQAFRKVWLIEYPRQGLWTIAFQTGVLGPSFNAIPDHSESLCVFVPTTPNPTSGFLLLVKKEDARTIDMTVDEAMKFVLSLGVFSEQSKEQLPAS